MWISTNPCRPKEETVARPLHSGAFISGLFRSNKHIKKEVLPNVNPFQNDEEITSKDNQSTDLDINELDESNSRSFNDETKPTELSDSEIPVMKMPIQKHIKSPSDDEILKQMDTTTDKENLELKFSSDSTDKHSEHESIPLEEEEEMSPSTCEEEDKLSNWEDEDADLSLSISTNKEDEAIATEEEDSKQSCQISDYSELSECNDKDTKNTVKSNSDDEVVNEEENAASQEEEFYEDEVDPEYFWRDKIRSLNRYITELKIRMEEEDIRRKAEGQAHKLFLDEVETFLDHCLDEEYDFVEPIHPVNLQIEVPEDPLFYEDKGYASPIMDASKTAQCFSSEQETQTTFEIDIHTSESNELENICINETDDGNESEYDVHDEVMEISSSDSISELINTPTSPKHILELPNRSSDTEEHDSIILEAQTEELQRSNIFNDEVTDLLVGEEIV